MSRLGTLVRTVRYLRPVQVFGRAWFRLYRPRADLRPAPPLRQLKASFQQPARRAPSLVGPARVRFLNQEASLAEHGWDDEALEKLWRYNLHYFDDLCAHGADQRVAWHRGLIANWIHANPPAQGTGWEPYPVSLRVVNWIKWILASNAPDGPMLDSLAVQVRWLRRRLEHHLLGNHLFANLKALAFAGAFFEGSEADAWLDQAVRGLEREIEEQVLSDGGQFERSPMYHALALEDVLDLIQLLTAFDVGPRSLRRRLAEIGPQMLQWLRVMTHPDGALAQFNDGAPGVAPDNAELERYAAEIGVNAPRLPAGGTTHLADSGYVRVERDGAVAFLDVAPVGPDYLPGHGHADTLSMELSIGTRRLIVNGGTSCYGSGAQRLFERGTAAHSTVQVAGRDSSEVWGGFRVGRRARITSLHAAPDVVDATHDGYRFLSGAPHHRRRWEFGSRRMRVTDRVEPARNPSVARFHLAAGLVLHDAVDATFVVREDGQDRARAYVRRGTARAVASLRAVAFGVLAPAHSLEVILDDGDALVEWTW
jgi:uncharacterized heparinase superfamily protein